MKSKDMLYVRQYQKVRQNQLKASNFDIGTYINNMLHFVDFNFIWVIKL